jgi:para-aminobenzoate synthetase / 4-amino-4-deoxychorismate lyase
MDEWYELRKQWRSAVAGSLNSVLLETSRVDSANKLSYLFRDPVQILSASTLDQIRDLFQQLEAALRDGFHVAGYVSYECGYHFQSLSSLTPSASDLPLAWFGVYREPSIYNNEKCQESESSSFIAEGFDNTSTCHATPVSLTIFEEDYCAKIQRIKEYIRAGDTYQVNLTDRIDTKFDASADEIFATLSSRQPVSYSTFLHLADNYILSLSPELFFRVDKDRIVTRPMKGTMPRGLDSVEDVEIALRLRDDEKNRAEHVMIVDLLRNDLGRICTMGSIQVEDLFSVEKYKTLFQMTSTVSGTLNPEISYYEIFKSMFPSGSITGAPKIRTMQIIHELEQRPRGIYTGAIGFIAPDRSSVFNVAIRTLVLKDGQATMGVGGGIVADSDPMDEYRECLLKANFLTHAAPSFQLLETMLWNGEIGLLDSHLDRMEASASYFGFPFDRQSIAAQLSAHAMHFLPGNLHRIRLLLDSAGKTTITATPYVPHRSTGRIQISPERTYSGNVFLRHKTTYRERYDRLYAQAHANGFDDIIFLNEREEVTEGAISNIFIERDGVLLTPPLRSGVLPGVFRRHLLELNATVEECILTIHDLESADRVFLCNSVRGMSRVLSFAHDDSGAQKARRHKYQQEDEMDIANS